MKPFWFLIVTLVCFSATAQEEQTQTVQGIVQNDADDKVLENVNIVNLNQVIGTVSERDGSFEIPAKVNDTLYFSYLGFKSIRVRVTNDLLNFGEIIVKMTELGIALEEVVVRPVELTGYLEIDAKIIPVYDDYRYAISGLDRGYEGGSQQPGAVGKVLSAIFNPADFLYNVFG